MKIENSLPTDSSQKIEKHAELLTPPKTKSANSNSSTIDASNLSASSQKVLDLHNAALQLPEVRQEKVDHLKKQVDTGTYHPTLQEIAQSVMNDLLGIQQ